MVGVRGIHSGSVIIAAGCFDDIAHILHIVDQVEGADFNILPRHPVTDFSRRIFRAEKNNSVQRNIHPAYKIGYKVTAANEAHQGPIPA